ncbi:choice-of-anchor E domain-containing protein [Glaciecola petra]|uniref:Choice-of-anchor E domain-containing protein n=1 Tax=Glaciecola petra TaxID=3075602 RepID=A0ABU2ZTB0_9ALTE|nr:choice-of-anchor E domain-containing protein [Aestuariibacter sp. P117]MDT0594799.1 choice-of-anchor E domain-containing protein [Aestuariibacter sp. P117]
MTLSITRAAFVLGLIGSLLTATFTAHSSVIRVSSDILGNTASIQKFDSKLGTLNFVRILYDVNVGVSSLFRNSNVSAITTTVNNNRLTLNGLGPDIFGRTPLQNISLASENIEGDIEIAGAIVLPSGQSFTRFESVQFDIQYTTTYDSRGITSRGFFGFSTNQFIGDDLFDFDFSASLDSPLTFTGYQPYLSLSSVPSISGFVEVAYDYTPLVVQASSPPVFFLSGIVLVAMLFLRRKRNSEMV